MMKLLNVNGSSLQQLLDPTAEMVNPKFDLRPGLAVVFSYLGSVPHDVILSRCQALVRTEIQKELQTEKLTRNIETVLIKAEERRVTNKIVTRYHQYLIHNGRGYPIVGAVFGLNEYDKGLVQGEYTLVPDTAALDFPPAVRFLANKDIRVVRVNKGDRALHWLSFAVDGLPYGVDGLVDLDGRDLGFNSTGPKLY